MSEAKSREKNEVKFSLDRNEKVCKMRASLEFAASWLGGLM